MSDATALEQSYRRWLRCYPNTFRREHETEILGVLMASAQDSQRRPALVECLDLLRSAIWMRLRPSVPRSDRSAFAAIRLMYVGAVVELVVALTVLATVGDVRSNIISRDPGFTRAQWRVELSGQLDHLVVAASIAVAFWLLMAWANGRGHRWARIAFAVFFSLNTFSLLSGLAKGSAVYAPADLAVGTALWLVELAALLLVFEKELRRIRVPHLGT